MAIFFMSSLYAGHATDYEKIAFSGPFGGFRRNEAEAPRKSKLHPVGY
jgi:hypothetical protein